MVEWGQMFVTVDKLRRSNQRYVKSAALLKNLLASVSTSWPVGLSFGEVFGIKPQDYGPYKSWKDKTSDSTFYETVLLERHLPSYNADLPVEGCQTFPGFLGLVKQGTDDGVAAWLLRGMSSLFPTGTIAYQGYRMWYYRCIDVATQMNIFLEGVRKLVWPSVDELDEGQCVPEELEVSCSPLAIDD